HEIRLLAIDHGRGAIGAGRTTSRATAIIDVTINGFPGRAVSGASAAPTGRAHRGCRGRVLQHVVVGVAELAPTAADDRLAVPKQVDGSSESRREEHRLPGDSGERNAMVEAMPRDTRVHDPVLIF